MKNFTERDRGSTIDNETENDRERHTETKAETEGQVEVHKKRLLGAAVPFVIVLFNTAYASRRARLQCLHVYIHSVQMYTHRYALPCTQLIEARLHGFGAVLWSSM